MKIELHHLSPVFGLCHRWHNSIFRATCFESAVCMFFSSVGSLTQATWMAQLGLKSSQNSAIFLLTARCHDMGILVFDLNHLLSHECSGVAQYHVLYSVDVCVYSYTYRLIRYNIYVAPERHPQSDAPLLGQFQHKFWTLYTISELKNFTQTSIKN